MTKKLTVAEMSISEAVDNLSSMAEIDTIGEGSPTLRSAKWLDPSSAEKTLKQVKQTFKVVRSYLEEVAKDAAHLQEEDTQRGVQAIMALATEAVHKVEACSRLFKGIPSSIETLPEYQELQIFYKEQISRRFKESLVAEEEWQEEWGGDGEVDPLDIQRRGLKDLETIKRDRNYELFYITKEDGRPFFTRNLLRHIRLVSDLDHTIEYTEEEDPLIRARLLVDHDLQVGAIEIRKRILSYLPRFCREAPSYFQEELTRNLYNSLIALQLASVNHNRSEHTEGKNTQRYFRDFQAFIREAVSSPDYYTLVARDREIRSSFDQLKIDLAHALINALFQRTSAQEDGNRMIYRLTGSSLAKKRVSMSSLSIWNETLDMYDMIQRTLRRYPSGPLLKTVDVFENKEINEGFDPLLQGNVPSMLYELSFPSGPVVFLRTPSPTKQTQIDKAQIVPEFTAFLRSLSHQKKPAKLLYINLQDRTSWEEQARSTLLEKLHLDAEFASCLTVVTLPKKTDFYFQSDAYLDLSDAENFMEACKEQVLSGEACGFYFPKALKGVETFSRKAIPTIHKLFFGSKKSLSRKNRLDFIEIFYLLLVYYLIEQLGPTHLTFACKDGVDTGESMAAAFFALSKLWGKEQQWSSEEVDYFHWMLFTPALLIRERVIDLQQLNRMVSSLSVIATAVEANQSQSIQVLTKLYERRVF